MLPQRGQDREDEAVALVVETQQPLGEHPAVARDESAHRPDLPLGTAVSELVAIIGSTKA